MAPLISSKQVLRKLFRDWLRAHATHRKDWDEQMLVHLKRFLDQNVKTHDAVGSYQALPDEPDLFQTTRKEHHLDWYFPRITSTSESLMDFFPWKGEEFREGPFGISEPTSPIPHSRELDALIVPGLSFDLAGFRLGRGKGFYDRYLHDHKPRVTIGIAYSGQIVEELPREPNDRPINFICTEQGIIDCGNFSVVRT